jgi:hypothetical protein
MSIFGQLGTLTINKFLGKNAAYIDNIIIIMKIIINVQVM